MNILLTLLKMEKYKLYENSLWLYTKQKKANSTMSNFKMWYDSFELFIKEIRKKFPIVCQMIISSILWLA